MIINSVILGRGELVFLVIALSEIVINKTMLARCSRRLIQIDRTLVNDVITGVIV